tara:strand:- start:10634 stop:10906 length:273 start_codon:yes stop_codon:yes gene_type:complete
MRATNDGLFPRSPIQTSNARGALTPVSNERDDTARRDDDDETRRRTTRWRRNPEDAIDAIDAMRCDRCDAIDVIDVIDENDRSIDRCDDR